MNKKYAKSFFVAILFISFVFPNISYADESIDTETLLVLQKQITLLLEEVTRLQELLEGKQTLKLIREPLSSSEITEVLSSGVDWFKNAQEENGHFRYEYLPYEDVYLDDDNIVRQAGGLYALGEILVHDQNEKFELKNTIQKSIGFFENLSSSGSVGDKKFRCITNSEINSLCQLGATSLALVGVIDLVERYPALGEQYDSLIQDYGNYIVAMKKKDSGFRGTYNDGSPLSSKESSFSNGEALLALVRFYKYEANEEVKKVIDDSFEYFESPLVEFDFPLYLWVMAALKDMNKLWEDERYVVYTKEYSEWRLNGFRYRKGTTHNMCAYIEGVISAYDVLEDSLTISERGRYLNEINFWLDKSRSLQLKEEDRFRIINDDLGVRFGEIVDTDKAFGGFLTDHTNLTERIDFTQHCLNSYLQKLVDIDGKEL